MMKIADILEAFKPLREGALVVPARGGRHWVPISDHAMLDAPMGDPAMGGHAGFAFGLALAQPDKKVVLFDSEGDILMSLGMLVTIAEQKPANFYHFLLDNECYATTGGQPVPNAKHVSHDAIARGCGYPRASAYTKLDELTRDLPGILAEPGPVFTAIKVFPEVQNEPIGNRRPWQTRNRTEVMEDLRRELGPTA